MNRFGFTFRLTKKLKFVAKKRRSWHPQRHALQNLSSNCPAPLCSALVRFALLSFASLCPVLLRVIVFCSTVPAPALLLSALRGSRLLSFWGPSALTGAIVLLPATSSGGPLSWEGHPPTNSVCPESKFHVFGNRRDRAPHIYVWSKFGGPRGSRLDDSFQRKITEE